MIKTKIVVTLGPSTDSRDKIELLGNEGVDCFRVNTAYGSIDSYSSICRDIKELTDVPIMFDLKGPEIRLHTDGAKEIAVGDIFEVGFNPESDFYFNHDFGNQISVGDRLFIDNGELETSIKEIYEDKLVLEIKDEGYIYSGKGVNLPSVNVDTPTFTERDLKLIELGLKLDVDYYALSFVRNRSDIEKLRSRLDDSSGVIGKIENQKGLENFSEILKSVDCVMVARGDLGIEVSLEKVPLAQKKLIEKCNRQGIPVITATEVLESMIEKPSPTRAEVSDAANAILDGTDSIMLSGETSIGRYPIESIEMLKRIATEVEPAINKDIDKVGSKKISESISKAVNRLCQDMDIDKVVALTKTGYTSRMISRFRIKQPIITVTPNPKVERQLKIVYGLETIQKNYANQKNQVLFVAKELLKQNYINEKDTILFTSTSKRPIDKEGDNIIEIHKIKDLDVEI
nr:pyruvate kinase [Methanonatronarchaeum thermophilum]